MVRYKRYRKYRRGSTGVITMKFQSFMDIATSDQSMQIITVSAGGKEVLRRLSPQFSAYKYYKLGNVAVKLVPASTLPVDPSGLSYEAGENQVDPRDQLTPGMMRITNGEDIFENLTGLSIEEQHAIYNNMLLDPRWFKWMLQSGVKRHGSPRYFTIGQLHQDKWPGAFVNVPKVDAQGKIVGTEAIGSAINNAPSEIQQYVNGSIPYGFFQTGHTGRLGWLPTDGMQHYVDAQSHSADAPLLASPPEVEMYKIILPPAYATKYYYRMFITETVYFKSPIVNYGIVSDTSSHAMYRPLDVFHYPADPIPESPVEGQIPMTDSVINQRTGGNDGSS